MYIPIGIKSDYSLLQSLIKIPELIEYLKANSINIGRRINNARPDLIYLGQNSCNVFIDETKVKVFNPKLSNSSLINLA